MLTIFHLKIEWKFHLEEYIIRLYRSKPIKAVLQRLTSFFCSVVSFTLSLAHRSSADFCIFHSISHRLYRLWFFGGKKSSKRGIKRIAHSCTNLDISTLWPNSFLLLFFVAVQMESHYKLDKLFHGRSGCAKCCVHVCTVPFNPLMIMESALIIFCPHVRSRTLCLHLLGYSLDALENAIYFSSFIIYVSGRLVKTIFFTCLFLAINFLMLFSVYSFASLFTQLIREKNGNYRFSDLFTFDTH